MRNILKYKYCVDNQQHGHPTTIANIIRESGNDSKYPVWPEKLVIDVGNALDENDIVLSDIGAHNLWISKIYKTYEPNTNYFFTKYTKDEVLILKNF